MDHPNPPSYATECDPDWEQRKAMANRKPGEVYPCVKATKALRECMEGKAVLAKHLVAMDEGIKEYDWRRWDPYVRAKAKVDARYRWWTGMKKSDEECY
ncbi:hypothetical protein D1007_33307 [Hordeum vulgare]|nr:hypothetical protein D1007_33307 [Hordeum vulgare]